MFRTLLDVHPCTLSATPAFMATHGEVKDPSDWQSFGTARNIERLSCGFSLDDRPLFELAFIYRWGLCKRFFAVSVYSCLNCFTMLLIFMPACWCKLAISTECLIATAIFSFKSQFDWYYNNIPLPEGETKQGGTCI